MVPMVFDMDVILIFFISNRFSSDFECLTSFRDFNDYSIISSYFYFIYSLFHVGFEVAMNVYDKLAKTVK
jgi:hypothetical protein